MKLDIVSQRFVGGKEFVKRWLNRLKPRENFGSRARAAENKIKERNRENNEQRAGYILNLVSREYDCAPDVLLQARKRKGNMGNARTVLANLLRGYLPWSCQEVAAFMKLRSYTTIFHHQEKMRGSKDLREMYQKIETQIIKQKY